MLTRHIAVKRSARYFVLGEPESDWSEVWYLLHGYGQRAQELLAACSGLARATRLLVAPEGLSRFYTRGTGGDVGPSWMTREERESEIADYVGYLDAVHCELRHARNRGERGGRVPVGILGFSQGTATASRWSVLGKIHPAQLVLWGSGCAPELEPGAVRAKLGETRVDLVLGDADPYVSRERGELEAQRLRDLLPQTEVRRFSGGHVLDSDLVVEITSARRAP